MVIPTRGFTLIELMIVVTILGILAGFIIVPMSRLLGTGRPEVLATTVTHMRDVIKYHSALRDCAMSGGGYPVAVDPDWFTTGYLPYHTWTNHPMIIELVEGSDTQVFPEVKTFDPDAPGAPNAWYNTMNGALCVRIGDSGSDETNIELFNIANSCQITILNQTTQ